MKTSTFALAFTSKSNLLKTNLTEVGAVRNPNYPRLALPSSYVWPRLASLAAGVALFCAGVATASADLLLRDSFGYQPITVNGGTRYDAASNTVAIFLTHDLSGLRAEFPNSSTEVWTAPGGHQVQTWGFSASSADPNEPYSPSEPNASNSVDNGSVTVTGGTGDTRPDCLLPFAPPATAFRVSIDAVSGANGVALGFTTTSSVLNSNFQSFG